MRSLISVTVLLLALTACGGGDDSEATSNDDPSTPAAADPSSEAGTPDSSAAEPSETATEAPDGEPELEMTDYGPTCDSMFIEGATMPEAAVDGCYDVADESITVSFTNDCADGRTLVQNPKGYGIVGEEIYLPAPGDDEPDVNSTEYQAVYDDCIPD